MKSKTIFGPSKKMMVGLLRSLFGRWKVIVFISFEPNLNLKGLLRIIEECENHSARVRNENDYIFFFYYLYFSSVNVRRGGGLKASEKFAPSFRL